MIEIDLTDYQPTVNQERFLTSRALLAALIGGLGSGKTRTGGEKALRLALLNPGCDGMMVAPTFSMLHRILLPAWESSCPPELILNHSRDKRCYTLRGGRKVWYGTAEVPKLLEGTNLAWYWGDEARYWPKQSHFNMLARLRDRRARLLQGIYTTTPSMGWLDEEFNRGIPGREAIPISTRENAHNLAPDYIENLERSYSARLCKSLIEGEFSVIEGQVYESFDEKRHVIDWKLDPTLRTTVWMDFGVRKGAVLFAQETGDYDYPLPGRAEPLPPHSLIVFDELMPEQKPTDRTLPMIWRRLAEHGLANLERRTHRLAAIYCDPAGRSRSIDDGMTSVHLLQSDFGRIVHFQTAAALTHIPNGIATVDGMLDPLAGRPRLYVDRRLTLRTGRDKDNDYSRGIVKSLRGLQYPPMKDGHPVSDHPVKDGRYEHAADTLRYGVLNSLVMGGRPVRQQRVNVAHGGAM